MVAPPGQFGLSEGQGLVVPPSGSTTTSELSREEHEKLADLLGKAGDAAGAARHRALAAPPPVAKEPTLQHHVSTAHSKLRGVERKLQGAVARYEEWSLQMVQQKALVTQLAAEAEECEIPAE